jgi:hypothetical protein
MDRDGSTAPPGDFPSRASFRVSRRAFKKLMDTPALTKMTVLLAKNEEMKIHTAARIAARYTTGACPDSIARRLVKRFPVAVSEFFITSMEKNYRDQFGDCRINLSPKDRIIFLDLLNLLEDVIEEDFLPLVRLSPTAVEMVFNNSEMLFSHVGWFYRAFVIFRIVRPTLYRDIIFTTSNLPEK